MTMLERIDDMPREHNTQAVKLITSAYHMCRECKVDPASTLRALLQVAAAMVALVSLKLR